jgi:molybdenum cofactor synthesis domain-containing protein
LEEQGWTITLEEVLPDEAVQLRSVLSAWADSGKVDLVLTTGGTGLAARDVTPEATLAVIERQVPGIAEAVRAAGLQKTPHAMLSRSLAGVRGRTLIVNLPGSPRGAVESLAVILPALAHAVQLLRDDPGSEASH